MASSISANVLLRIEKNPYCVARNTDSLHVLKFLMKHSNPEVRLATTFNNLIKKKLLSTLVNDKDHYVRYAVAIHQLTCSADLIKLSNDKNKLVRKGVSENFKFSQ